MNTEIPIVDRIPGLGLLVSALLMGTYIAELAILLGLLITFLEIESIYTRLLPTWSEFQYLIGLFVSFGLTIWFRYLLNSANRIALSRIDKDISNLAEQSNNR